MRIETQDIHWLKSPAFFGSTEKVWNSFEGFEIKSNEIKVLLNQFNSERLVLPNRWEICCRWSVNCGR
jgi:hypothetical protein